MTTQDILYLEVSLIEIVTVCRGEWSSYEDISGEIRLFDTIANSGKILSDISGFLEYLATGGKIEPIVRELEESLRDFLEGTATRRHELTQLYLSEGAKKRLNEFFDNEFEPKAITDEIREVTYNAMEQYINLCSYWVEWIEKYFPSRDGAQLPGDPARILPVTPRPGMEPGTREASTPSRIAATNEIKSCLLVSTDNQDKLLKKLHQLIDGNKGKRVALVVRLCVDLGLMSKPTFGVLAKEFPKIGNKAGYNRYYKSFQEPIYCKDFEAEINGIKQHLTPFKNQI